MENDEEKLEDMYEHALNKTVKAQHINQLTCECKHKGLEY